MSRPMNLLSDGRIVLISFALAAIFSLYLFPRAAAGYRAPGSPDVIDLQMAFSKARFTAILQEWIDYAGMEAIAAFRRTLLLLDIAFPVIYAVFLASLFAWLVRLGHGELTGWRQIIFGLPFLAAFFDLSENTVHYLLLSSLHSPADLSGLPAGPIFLASLLAALKYACIAVSALASLVLILRLLYGVVFRY